MSTQVSIEVQAKPKDALKCAYDVLRSFDKIGNGSLCFDEQCLFTSVCIRYSVKPIDVIRWEYCILINAKKKDDSNCELVFTVDADYGANYHGGAGSVRLLSEILTLFSQNISQISTN